jgi:hypothetical protein
MSTRIELGPATLERVRPDLVVVRFNPGTVADPASFQLSMDARKKHCSDTPHAVVLVAPDEVDFSPSVLGKNHYKDQGTEAFTRALAIVSRNPTFTNILELYYALHPAPFPVKFFSLETDALVWVEAVLAQKKP